MFQICFDWFLSKTNYSTTTPSMLFNFKKDDLRPDYDDLLFDHDTLEKSDAFFYHYHRAFKIHIVKREGDDL